MKIAPAYLIAGGAVLAALAWAATRGNARGLGATIGGGAVDLVNGVLTGAGSAVVGVANKATGATKPDGTPGEGNFISRGVNEFGQWFTRDEGWTLGGQIFDWTN